MLAVDFFLMSFGQYCIENNLCFIFKYINYDCLQLLLNLTEFLVLNILQGKLRNKLTLY